MEPNDNQQWWQTRLVMDALQAGTVTEDQAVILAALYFHANWQTGILTDFRATRLCDWLHRPITYERAMQRRLKDLRELGWFHWSYRKGEKVPYDIHMRKSFAAAAGTDGVSVYVCDRPAGTPDCLSFNTLISDSAKHSTESQPQTQGSALTVLPSPSPTDGDIHTQTVEPSFSLAVKELQAAIFEATRHILTPLNLVDDLLKKHSAQEVLFALKELPDNAAEIRFRKPLTRFLTGGGIAVTLANSKKWLLVSLSQQQSGDIQKWTTRNIEALGLFPDVARAAFARIQAAEEACRAKAETENRKVKV